MVYKRQEAVEWNVRVWLGSHKTLINSRTNKRLTDREFSPLGDIKKYKMSAEPNYELVVGCDEPSAVNLRWCPFHCTHRVKKNDFRSKTFGGQFSLHTHENVQRPKQWTTASKIKIESRPKMGERKKVLVIRSRVRLGDAAIRPNINKFVHYTKLQREIRLTWS